MFLLGSEHNPPHIHVVYGEHSALFDIQTIEMLEGDLPTRAEAMVKEEKMSVGLESLHKSLSRATKPRFETIYKILLALGLRLSINSNDA